MGDLNSQTDRIDAIDTQFTTVRDSRQIRVLRLLELLSNDIMVSYLATRSIKKGVKMLIVHVFVHVKPHCVEAFKEATIENARNSVQEPGIARFDVVQQSDDLTRFVLVEMYRTPDAPARHKETAHYQTWRDTVADMMAEPRSSIKYGNVFPTDKEWK